MRSSFGRDSSDGYCVAFAQSLGHVLIAYTPVGLYAGSLSRPRLMPETSVIPAYSKFGDRNFAPNGAKREARFSGAALRAHAVVSPLKFSAESRYIFSPKKFNEIPYNPSVSCADSSLCTRELWWGGAVSAPFAQGSHGWKLTPSLFAHKRQKRGADFESLLPLFLILFGRQIPVPVILP